MVNTPTPYNKDHVPQAGRLITEGNLAGLKSMLDSYSGLVNAVVEKNGYPLFYHAIHSGNMEMVKAFIWHPDFDIAMRWHHEDPETGVVQDISPRKFAAKDQEGNEELAALLKQDFPRAELFQIIEKFTPASAGTPTDEKMLARFQELLANEAAPADILHLRGFPLLDKITVKGHHELLRPLLAHAGMQVDPQSSILHTAVNGSLRSEADYATTAAVLVRKHPALAFVKDKQENTPLQLAINNEKVQIMERLAIADPAFSQETSIKVKQNIVPLKALLLAANEARKTSNQPPNELAQKLVHILLYKALASGDVKEFNSLLENNRIIDPSGVVVGGSFLQHAIAHYQEGDVTRMEASAAMAEALSATCERRGLALNAPNDMGLLVNGKKSNCGVLKEQLRHRAQTAQNPSPAERIVRVLLTAEERVAREYPVKTEIKLPPSQQASR